MKRKTQCSAAKFVKDVEKHEMMVLHDDGDINRHVRFQDPGTSNHYFDLITWEGRLCICGDMGIYVFARLRDMFDFFRVEERLREGAEQLYINEGYWAEKVVADDRHGRIKEYCSEMATEYFEEWLNDYDGENAAQMRAEIEEQILRYVDEGEHDFRDVVSRFEFEGEDFEGFWEVELRDYTYQFLWCLYAIVWGIQRYDEQKAAAAVREGVAA